MIDKLEDVERRFERLTAQLSSPDTLGDSAQLLKVSRERAGLEKLVETFRAYKGVLADLGQAEEWLQSNDAGEREMAKEELPSLRTKRDAFVAALKILLLPKDPNDEKNVILEIRAGAGGDEAALFAEEVMQMYLRYSDAKGWKADIVFVESGGRTAVFTADMIPTTAHIDDPWIMGYDLYPMDTLAFKRSFIREAIDRDYLIFFEHDPDIPAGYIREANRRRSVEPVAA